MDLCLICHFGIAIHGYIGVAVTNRWLGPLGGGVQLLVLST